MVVWFALGVHADLWKEQVLDEEGGFLFGQPQQQ
jgi:hypothetical protein